MAIREEKNRRMIAWCNQAMPRLKVISCCSSMVMLWRYLIIRISRRQLFRFHCSTSDLTTSSALRTFQSWNDSSISRSYCSKITTFIVSFKFQNWKPFKILIHSQLKTMRCQTQCFLELSLFTDSQTWQRSTLSQSMTLTSKRLDSSFSILTRSCLPLRSFHQRFKRNLILMIAKKIARIKSKILDFRLRRMRKLPKASLEISHSFVLRRIRELMSSTIFGVINSKRSLFHRCKNWLQVNMIIHIINE